METMNEIKMPCGSNHSCIDCAHFVWVTDPCSHLQKMSEDEYDEFLKMLTVFEQNKQL